MGCLIRTEENKQRVLSLATLLANGNDSEIEKYKKIAYYLLSANGGNDMNMTLTGEDSKLFQDLLDHYGDDKRLAILAKGYIFTSLFAKTYGNWMEESQQEPTISQLLLSREGVEKYFDNVSNEEILIEADNLLSNNVITYNAQGILESKIQADCDAFVERMINSRSVQDEINDELTEHINQYYPAGNITSEESERLRQVIEDKKRIELKRKYGTEKISQLLWSLSEKLFERWGMSKYYNEKTGEYTDQYSSMDNVDTDDFKAVIQFRINLLRWLERPIRNVEDFDLILLFLSDLIEGKDEVTISSNIIQAYFTLNKDSKLVFDLLEKTGLVKYKNGKPTDRSVSKAIQKVTEYIKEESDDFIKNRNKIKKWFINKYKAIKQLSKLAFAATGKIAYVFSGSIGVISAISAAYFGDFSLLSSLLIGVGATLTSRVVSVAIDKLIGNSIEQSDQLRQMSRTLIMASAVNLNLEKADMMNDSNYFMRRMFVPYIFKAPERTLKHIRDILQSQLTALQVQARKSDESDNKFNDDIDNLTTLLNYCDEALIKDKNHDLYEQSRTLFYYKYLIDYMAPNILESISRLEYWNNHPDDIDVKELMRIKTDVIGAFYNAVSNEILPNMEALAEDNSEFGQNGMFRKTVIEHIQNDLNRARSLLELVVFKHCDNVIDDMTEKHFGHTTDSKKTPRNLGQDGHLEALKNNLKSWLRNEAITGDISSIESWLVPAKNGKSPLISMLVLKMEEIEATVTKESDEEGQSLINTMREVMGSRFKRAFNFKNALNKYAERDEGLFTGFFKSAVKRGKYLRDRKEMISLLAKKHGIKEENNHLLWDEDYSNEEDYQYSYTINGVTTEFNVSSKQNPSEQPFLKLDRWQAFQIDLALWQAGAEMINGQMVLKPNVEPRIHLRKTVLHYIIKYTYLNREDCTQLGEINQQILKLQKRCEEVVEVNGKRIRVFITAKLTESERNTLRQLKNRKDQLSCFLYFLTDNVTGKVTAVKEKISEVERKRALRFLAYNQAKLNYEDQYRIKKLNEIDRLLSLRQSATTQEEKDDIDNQINALSPDTSLYEAVLAKYNEKIKKLEESIKDSTDTDFVDAVKEEIKKIEHEKETFLKDNTTLALSPILRNIIKSKRKINFDVFNQALVEYLQAYRSLQLLKNQLRSAKNKLRIVDVKQVESETDEDTKKTWLDIIKLCQTVEDCKHNIETLLQEESNESNKIDSSALFERRRIPVLDSEGRETNVNAITYLTEKYGFSRDDLKIYMLNSGNYMFAPIFYMSSPNSDITDILVDENGNKIFDDINDVYVDKPTGIFSGEKSAFDDTEFDEESEEYTQINGKRKEYDNSKEYDEIKNDKLYNAMLRLMDLAYKNMPGITRRSRYLMPQLEASLGTMNARVFINGKHFGSTIWGNMKRSGRLVFGALEQRDTEINEEVLTKSDGTVVETIPTRFISKIADANTISTDLISTVMDFYTESLRYKYRTNMQYTMDAFLFALSGGYTTTSDAPKTNLADVLRSEMSKTLYGRNIIGSGLNGRLLRGERRMAAITKRIRSLLHTRLMANNDLSVMKNAFDSFCNIFTAAYDNRWFTTWSLLRGIGKLGSNAFSALFSIYSAKACNFTQGLFHLNGTDKSIHERYEGLNKHRLRRIIVGTANAMFEFVDYTAKAIITEAVYDNFRLMYNPMTKLFDILTHNEALRVYSNPREGHDAWCKFKDYTLRSMYEFNEEEGLCKLRESVKINYNGTTYDLNISDLVTDALLTRVRSYIRSAATYCNGMLDKEDKPSMARHWLGAMVTSYRGWMITQNGENAKDGYDFSQVAEDAYDASFIQRHMNRIKWIFNNRRSGFNEDAMYEGKANWGTGGVETGYHKNLAKTLFSHALTSLSVVLIPGLAHLRSVRYQKNITPDEMLKITHFAANVQWSVFICLAAMMSYMWAYGDGDDKDKKWDWLKMKLYAACVASISERFTSVSRVAFLINLSDIVNSITVANTLFDDAVYVWNTMNTIGDFFSDKPFEETESGHTLTNGSFAGKTKAQRNITRALALTGVNTLPGLVTLDAIKQTGLFGKNFENVTFRDYNLNYFKYHNKKPAEASAKWYGTLFPVPQANWAVETLSGGKQHILKPSKGKSGKKKSKQKKEPGLDFTP